MLHLIALAVMVLSTSLQPLLGETEDCRVWESKIKTLSSRDREALAQNGVIYRGVWIFSSRLIHSCDARQSVAWYFERVIQGKSDEAVVRFGWLNSDLLNKIVSKVWPLIGLSAAIPNDGSFSSESWALLRQPWMDSRTLTSTLRDEIRLRGKSS